MGRLDLAVVGAGAAGTFVADAMQAARPDWSIGLFERSDRIGGRLRSGSIPGIDHRIELGGMRFLTSHRRVATVVEAFGLPTHPFDRTGGPERSFLRGQLGDGPGDPRAGRGYHLAESERGRAASDLALEAFESVIPGASTLDASAYAGVRTGATFRGRRVIDWSIGDAVAATRSPEACRFVTDAFGYDSGMRAFNAGDAIEFLLGGGDPTAEARVPDEGMDAIPRALAERFRGRGGAIHHGRELRSLEATGEDQRLVFADGQVDDARQVVLALPIAALERLAASSAALRGPAFRRAMASVEGFPAIKLYLWYERPWWRDSVHGIRTTTDLTIRKVFYLDTGPDEPAALLAMYTDGLDVRPWLPLLGNDVVAGAAAPEPLLAEVLRQLALLHPDVPEIPRPSGSALMHWGADPNEIGWTFWRPGVVSDEIIRLTVQPDPSLRLHLAGETFSRSQSWVEGALESAELVVERLRSAP